MQELSKKKMGERLRAIRLKRGIGMTKMARDLKVSRQGLYDLENGAVGVSLPHLQKIADYFGVSPFDILKGKNGRKTA